MVADNRELRDLSPSDKKLPSTQEAARERRRKLYGSEIYEVDVLRLVHFSATLSTSQRQEAWSDTGSCEIYAKRVGKVGGSKVFAMKGAIVACIFLVILVAQSALPYD